MANQYSGKERQLEIGYKKGLLTVVGPIRREPRPSLSRPNRTERVVDLACDCGNKKTMVLDNFIKPYVVSCGCHRTKMSRENGEARRTVFPGQRYGKLTVLEGSERRAGGWFDEVRCSCGTEFYVDRGSLPSGNSKSCKQCGWRQAGLSNTITMETGRRFGKLTVIRDWGSHTCGTKKVLVRCGCGRQEIVRYPNLITGNTSACGVCKHRHNRRGKDLNEVYPLGYRAGRLVVIKHWGSYRGGDEKVLYQCDCGNQHIAGVGHIYYPGSGQYKYCPKCVPTGSDGVFAFNSDPERANSPCHVYLARINGAYLKPGISKDPDRRADRYYSSYAFTSPTLTRAEAWAIEQRLLKESMDAKPETLPEIYDDWGGVTELRLKDALPESWYISRFWELMEELDEEGWEAVAEAI